MAATPDILTNRSRPTPAVFLGQDKIMAHPTRWLVNRYGLALPQGLLLAAITALAYANTIANPFVFDDRTVLSQPWLKWAGFDFENLTYLLRNCQHKFRPVANLSFALNYFFDKNNVVGYHLVNISIHLITGLFLFFLTRTTLNLPNLRPRYHSLPWLPFASALLWLVNPIQTQSVTYVVQRMNSMAAMFFLIALYSYVRGRLAEKLRARIALFACALTSGFLAFGSKEIAATLPFFIVLYEWYFLQDLDGAWLKKHGFKLGAACGLVLLALGIFYLGRTPFNSLLAGYAARDFSLGERLLTESRVVIFYLSLLLFPYPGRLNLDHDFVISRSLLAPPSTSLALAALALLLVAAVLLARRHRLLSFGLLWFLGNLVIESSIVPLEIVFEHRLYLPSTMLVAALVASCGEYFRFANRTKLAAVLLLTMVLTAWTYQRNQVWSDEVTLWRDCVAKSPTKTRVHNNLGVALKQAGRLTEAEDQLQRAIKLDRTFAGAYNNLGNVKVLQGRTREAIALYYQAIELNPGTPSWHLNLANTLVKVWRLEEAREQFLLALALDPANIKARNGLAKVNRMLARNRSEAD